MSAETKQPAAPQAELAAWRADHLLLLEDIEYAVDIRVMQAHLAAMPQAQPAALQADLAAWRNKMLNLLGVAAIRPDLYNPLVIHLAAMPQAQPDAELLKALKEIDKIGALLYPNGADVMDDNPFAGQVSEMWRIAAAAIAQAKKGAPA